MLVLPSQAGAASTGGLAWNASADWRATGGEPNANPRNPNGSWSYLESTKPGGEAIRLWALSTTNEANWSGFQNFCNRNLAGKNMSASPIFRLPEEGGAWLKPGQVALYPGLDRTQDLAILRWTAPCRARVKVSATFTGNHIPTSDKDPGTISRAMLIRNGLALWSARINGFVGCKAGGREFPRTGSSPSQTCTKVIEVDEGDTLDFACDFAATPTGNMWNGLTGVDASIEIVRILPRTRTETPVKGWRDALRPKGKPGPLLTLATGGRTGYVIVIPSKPTAQDAKAASELRLWLSSMTGADFRVFREGSAPRGKVISIGRTKLLARANPAGSREKLGDEGYAISISGDTLFLFGGARRGSINAVYALLEEDLGCRWYDTYSANIPTQSTLKVRPVPRHYVPALKVRDPYYWDALDAEWSLRNRTNSPAVAIPKEWGGNIDCKLPPKTVRPNSPTQFHFATESQEFQATLDARQASDPPMYVWQQTVHPAHLSVPMPNMPVVDRDIDLYTKLGAVGVTLQGSYHSPGGDNAAMRCWVWAKKLWDPSLDTRELMRDFIFGYYKEAAQPIWDYNMELWRIWEQYHAQPVGTGRFMFLNETGYVVDNGFLGREFIDKSLDLFEQARKLAKTPETRRRVALAEYPLLYAFVLERIGYFEPSRKDIKPFHPWIIAGPDWERVGKMLDDYEAIGRIEGVTHISEGWPNLGFYTSKLEGWGRSDIRNTNIDYVNGTWKVRPDPQDIGLKEKWFAPDLDESSWSSARSDIGGGWKQQGLDVPPGLVWYRRPLDIPAALLASKQIYIHFAGVDGEAEVFINGKKAFAHTVADTKRALGPLRSEPFVFDIKPFLRPEGGNIMAVRVRTDSDAGGIWKYIFLLTTDLKPNALVYDVAIEKCRQQWTNWGRANIWSRSSHPLSPVWKFKPDPQDVGATEKWFSPEVDESGWPEVRCDMECGYESQGFAGYLGVSWYRQRFRVPPAFASARQLFLQFVAVDEQAEVYVNGQKAFAHTIEAAGSSDARLWDAPFAFEITPFLRPGENTVAVRVINEGAMGGIWRPVYLAVPNLKPGESISEAAIRDLGF